MVPEIKHFKEYNLYKFMECTKCNKKFVNNKGLKYHNKNPNCIHECPRCFKKYASKYVLNRHESLNICKQKYKCKKCNNIYRTEYILGIHKCCVKIENEIIEKNTNITDVLKNIPNDRQIIITINNNNINNYNNIENKINMKNESNNKPILELQDKLQDKNKPILELQDIPIINYSPVCLYDQTSFHISDLNNENMIYIGYIGIYNNEHTFKFGISSRVVDRDFKEHKKMYGNFQIIYVKDCNNNKKVEKIFRRDLKLRQLHRNININNINRNELFIINKEYDITNIIKILEKIIDLHPTKNEILQMKSKINELEKSISKLIN